MKVWVQEWEESEAGWGSRFDGYSLHDSAASAKQFVIDHWNSQPDEVPECYSRPDGNVFVADAPDDIKEGMLVAAIKGRPLWVHESNTEWIKEGKRNR